jgi:spore maturation protein CgeB
MRNSMRSVLRDEELARAMADSGLETILTRHTCAHRVEELLAIYRSLTRTAVAHEVAR